MALSDSSEWKDALKRFRNVPFLDGVVAHVQRLSPGDRALYYLLGILVGIAALFSLYTLEGRLLVLVPSYGGSLSEGKVGSPQFINPLLAITDADRDLSALVYAGLMGVAPSGGLEPVLAEGYSISEDGKSYTFTLRKNAVFSDGTPVTSDDVVFTVGKAQDAALKSPEYANWAGVTVAALDPHTIRFTLTKAYAPFIELTTLGILPSRLWQNISSGEFPFSTFETNPIGAGPFTVANVGRNASGLIKNITLEANKRYALGRPYLDTLYFTFYSRVEDLASALQGGSVESAYDIPLNGALIAPYARVFAVFWNPSEKQVYARSEVRKALSLALDRKAIVTDVLGGYATPIFGPVPPGGSITQAALPQSDNPISDAAKTLETGGWAYDGAARIWKNAASKQILDRITVRTSNVPELKNVASAVKSAWEKLGIPVDIELYEPGDLSQNVIRPRKYEALLYGEVIGREQDLYAFWDSQERNDPGLNVALYANKTVDALLEDARNTGDERTRLADLQKVENAVAADYPAAFIYAPDFTYVVPKDLKGVILPQIVTPSDRFASVTKWYRVTDAVWPFFTR